MAQDNRIVVLSALKADDVVEVHTQNSVYRCVFKDSKGFATVTGSTRKAPGPYEGFITGVAGLDGSIEKGILRPGGRLHFNFTYPNIERVFSFTSSPITRIVVNGGPILTHFGPKKSA